MLSIDEAIEDFKTMAKNARNDIINSDDIEPQEKHYNSQLELYAKEKEQLAKWLEELKSYREIGTVEGYKNAIECYTEEYTIRKSNKQYNKAIDDLMNEVCMHFADWEYSEDDEIIKQIIKLASESVEAIAEQLKKL